MGTNEVAIIEDHGTINTNTNSIRRKTPLQLKTLESLYSEDNYPTQRVMKDYAAALGLTYKQVRGWFFERRRKEKNENGMGVSSSKKLVRAKNGIGVVAAKKIIRRVGLAAHCRGNMSSSSTYNRACLGAHHWHCFRNHDSRAVERGKILNEDLSPTDYILKKVFRKDGPPLGVEFDSLPSSSFCHCTDSRNSHRTCQENQTSSKRRKVSKPAVLHQQFCNNKSAPAKIHGIGKGLMTVWRATNPGAGDFPTGIDFADGQVAAVSPTSTSILRKSLIKKKKPRKQSSVTKWKSVGGKLNDKKKPSRKRGKVECNKDVNQKKPNKEKCELALEEGKSQEHLDQFAMLMDDEELELQESQAGPNPVTCSAHFATNGLHGCSLCKDLLAKFPPNAVKMKQPFCMQPWDSSPELVKKMFKVLHFLYTYSVVVDVCPFTLDEFAQAFHDEDSLLLGKVHLALLNLLLSDVETELSSGFLPHVIKNCKFLGLLQSVGQNEFVLKFWKRSLNPLTWTEILRQVLVAAGFGSRKGTLRREALDKELNPMVKYGLRPGTLKGELFSILSNQGNNGMKVPDLARCVQISELNLAGTTDELELLIYSTLSSDITLYEKISSSSYRLRITSHTNEAENFQSDTDDSGSIDDDSKDSRKYSSSDDSDSDSGTSNLGKLNYMNHHKQRNGMLTIYTEIDESNPGEVWLLGLMEGEYSDLSIEEKLNALMALVDLVSGGSSIRMEDLTKAVVEYVPNIHHYGSGAKIKRSYTKQHNLPTPAWGHFGQMLGGKEIDTSSELCPVDSSTSISKFHGKEKFSSKRKETREAEVGLDLHPMQSVFLGPDRRYNRYWLFLGPCNANDPGHKRVYFESSEDGHWEVIDTEEAFCALLSVLDGRGKREAFLLASLEKRKASLCQEMSSRIAIHSGSTSLTQYDRSDLYMIREDSSSPVSDIVDNPCATDITNDFLASSGAIVLGVGKKGEEQKQRWRRLQEFDAWIWSSFYSDLNAVKHGKRTYLDSLARCESCHDLYWRDEKHCKTCHTTFELDFDLEEKYAIHIATCREKEDNDMFPKHKVLSSQLQSLKAAIHAIESVMPEDALVEAWSKSAHKLWVRRLRRTSYLTELLQVLADFVGAIKEDWLCQSDVVLGSNNLLEEIVVSFSTMPQTSSAVALWLVKLDALIAPHLERVQLHSKKRTRNWYLI